MSNRLQLRDPATSWAPWTTPHSWKPYYIFAHPAAEGKQALTAILDTRRVINESPDGSQFIPPSALKAMADAAPQSAADVEMAAMNGIVGHNMDALAAQNFALIKAFMQRKNDDAINYMTLEFGSMEECAIAYQKLVTWCHKQCMYNMSDRWRNYWRVASYNGMAVIEMTCDISRVPRLKEHILNQKRDRLMQERDPNQNSIAFTGKLEPDDYPIVMFDFGLFHVLTAQPFQTLEVVPADTELGYRPVLRCMIQQNVRYATKLNMVTLPDGRNMALPSEFAPETVPVVPSGHEFGPAHVVAMGERGDPMFYPDTGHDGEAVDINTVGLDYNFRWIDGNVMNYTARNVILGVNNKTMHTEQKHKYVMCKNIDGFQPKFQDDDAMDEGHVPDGDDDFYDDPAENIKMQEQMIRFKPAFKLGALVNRPSNLTDSAERHTRIDSNIRATADQLEKATRRMMETNTKELPFQMKAEEESVEQQRKILRMKKRVQAEPAMALNDTAFQQQLTQNLQDHYDPFE